MPHFCKHMPNPEMDYLTLFNTLWGPWVNWKYGKIDQSDGFHNVLLVTLPTTVREFFGWEWMSKKVILTKVITSVNWLDSQDDKNHFVAEKGTS